MRKLLSLVVAVCFLTMSFSLTAFASLEKPIETGPNPGKNLTVASDIFKELSYSEILEKIEEQHRKTFVPKASDYAKAERIIELSKLSFATENNSYRSDYDENKALLRAGNLIELTLDIDEGISETTAVRAIALASTAKSIATSNFPNFWDSGQHFIWNYNMTETFGKTTARTVGINHEWGIKMVVPMTNYYDSSYSDRIAAGETEHDASSGALVDTMFYIPEFKYIATTIMPQSYEFFCSFFDSDNIMDFWNNCYGRAYGERSYSSAISAYTAAKNAGELIVDTSGENRSGNVTSNHFYNVWDWDWYSY